MNISFTKKGFTLIELMIVIVILGVLMSTILPKLTGAQARARDAGRVADLRNIESALQIYFDDNGEYPKAPTGGDCLASSPPATPVTEGNAGFITQVLAPYLKGNKVPTDPLAEGNATLCASGGNGLGQYWYKDLTKNNIDQSSYVLCADMESWQKANTILSSASSTHSGNSSDAKLDKTKTTFGDINTSIGIDLTGETTAASTSVYCIIQ